LEVRAGGGAGLRRARRRRPGPVALAALVYLVAALLAAAPAIRHAHTDFLAGGAPGHGEAAAGDHLQTAYRLWLPGHELEEGRAPWRDPYSFRPEAAAQLNPAAWPFGLPFWPLWRALGLVVGWNVFVLLGLIAAGLATFAWLRELDVGVGAALVGGLAFEIAPYRLEQSTEHLLGPISILLPLSLWALERGRRGSRWWLVLSVVAIASIAASGQVHLALGAVPFYLAFALVRTQDRVPRAGALIGAALAVAAGILLWHFVIDGSIGEGGRSLRQVRHFSATWLDFVVRHERHGPESFVFLGWLTPLVAIAGLVVLVRRHTYGLATLLGISAFVPILFALGTTTPLYRLVRFVVYPLRYPRVPERLMPIACLAIAALVAFAVSELSRARLPRRVPQQAVVIAIVAVVLLGADLRVTTFEATAADEGNAAYSALRSSPPGRLLEVPVFRPGIHYGGVYLYYDTQARRQRPQGYSTLAPVVTDRVAKRLSAINCGDWSQHPERLLARLGVRNVAFHTGLFRDNPEAPDTAAFAWRGLVREGYRPVAAGGPVTLLARGGGPEPEPPVAEPPRDVAVFCDGWSPNAGSGRTMTTRHASLWAYNVGGADLRLYLSASRPVDVQLHIDGQLGDTHTISKLAETRVPLGDERWHLVKFDAPSGAGVRVVAYAVG
jgi:hypothetical protein